MSGAVWRVVAIWVAAYVVTCGCMAQSATEDKAAPFPGERTTWNGYDRYNFVWEGHPCIIVAPKEPASGKPWMWRARFFDYRPEPEIALLSKGFHVAHIGLGPHMGSPWAISRWNEFYRYLIETYGFAPKVALSGTSRGGLYLYNWAIANPDKTACIFADAAVVDFKSWPGGKPLELNEYQGIGAPGNWLNILRHYGFKDTEEALAYGGNPIDNLEPLAKAGVPILHLHGNNDEYVPKEENVLIVAKRYKELGGDITVILHDPSPWHGGPDSGGGGGHIAGLEDPTPIVDFILRNTVEKQAVLPNSKDGP